MAMSADDIADFFDEDMPGFALAIIGSGETIPGLFRDQYDPAFGGIVGDSSVRFICAVNPALLVDSLMTIDNTVYTIAAVEPNRTTGKVTVRLK